MGSCRSKINVIAPVLKSIKSETLAINPNAFIIEGKRKLHEVYTLGKILGRGGFSEVRLLIHLESKAQYAVKILRKNTCTANSEENFLSEIAILTTIDHPNIIKIIEYFEDEKSLYIVMEKCEGGELYERILKEKCFPEDRAARLMRQLLSAVWHIHQRQIVHRDIKPQNIIFENQDALFNIKLIDFGLSIKIKENKLTKEVVGDMFYISPESLDGRYSSKCDMWSCGVLAYVMLCGVPPFDGQKQCKVFKKISKMKFKFNQPVWRSLSTNSQDFIKKLLCPESSRMSASEALQHPWVADIEMASLEKQVFQHSLHNFGPFHSTNKLTEALHIYMSARGLTLADIKQFKQVFVTLDSDYDGKISKEEVLEYFRKTIGDKNFEKDVENIIRAYDSENNGFINCSNFLKAYIDYKKESGMKNLRFAFESVDIVKDESISLDELKHELQNCEYYDETVWNELICMSEKNKWGN